MVSLYTDENKQPFYNRKQQKKFTSALQPDLYHQTINKELLNKALDPSGPYHYPSFKTT